ncbi:unnamed protein product [Heligmosomoides polygyrus]|uniref:Uncharacterized protein n=1 Tax=Heligmosomoides polygyrus TaxID=6339 RepID=A0A3P7UG70_HELPZ|nr:unnamed protein product [Heligmosomoides polygyrus]
MESLGVSTNNDTDEAAVIKFMDAYRKTISIENGNITAGFPFTDEVSNLKDNFNVAYRRLQNLLRSLQGDKEKYRMNLRDYLSNSAHVNIEIPASDRASSTEIKVLGILWNAMEDTISLKLFVDSSKRAYACSIYVTTTSCHGVKESRLFTAKSKIAPINKEQTIPRLELLSIFIGLGLVESTIQKINVKFEKISIFSDSTIALCWIQGNRRLPPIVSTLVQKISLITKRLREFIDVTFFPCPHTGKRGGFCNKKDRERRLHQPSMVERPDLAKHPMQKLAGQGCKYLMQAEC